MIWGVFSDTTAGPGFLAGDYFGASGEVTIAAGLGANVLVGGSNRTVALQPVSIDSSVGLNRRRRGGTPFASRPLSTAPIPVEVSGRHGASFVRHATPACGPRPRPRGAPSPCQVPLRFETMA